MKNTKIIIGVLIVSVIAGVIGWRLGHRNTAQTANPASSNSTAASQPAAEGDPRALVSYTLPDAWREGSCPNVPNKVFIVPAGSSLQCDSTSIAPIRILVDPQHTTDCQSLNSPTNATKHTCKSLFINGHKSLQALTTVSGKTVSDYYIDTGKGVVRVEYDYASSSDYQTGFDQLANSVKVK